MATATRRNTEAETFETLARLEPKLAELKREAEAYPFTPGAPSFWRVWERVFLPRVHRLAGWQARGPAEVCTQAAFEAAYREVRAALRENAERQRGTYSDV